MKDQTNKYSFEQIKAIATSRFSIYKNTEYQAIKQTNKKQQPWVWFSISPLHAISYTTWNPLPLPDTGFPYQSELVGKCWESNVNTLKVWGCWCLVFYFTMSLVYSERLNRQLLLEGIRYASWAHISIYLIKHLMFSNTAPWHEPKNRTWKQLEIHFK